jgi:dienelactone hydrolase
MQPLDRNATDKILQAGLDYLKQPGRKIATIGFSMGGQESLNAHLNDPKAVNASVMVYGSGFDKIDTKGSRDCRVRAGNCRRRRHWPRKRPSIFSPP